MTDKMNDDMKQRRLRASFTRQPKPLPNDELPGEGAMTDKEKAVIDEMAEHYLGELDKELARLRVAADAPAEKTRPQLELWPSSQPRSNAYGVTPAVLKADFQ